MKRLRVEREERWRPAWVVRGHSVSEGGAEVNKIEDTHLHLTEVLLLNSFSLWLERRRHHAVVRRPLVRRQHGRPEQLSADQTGLSSKGVDLGQEGSDDLGVVDEIAERGGLRDGGGGCRREEVVRLEERQEVGWVGDDDRRQLRRHRERRVNPLGERGRRESVQTVSAPKGAAKMRFETSGQALKTDSVREQEGYGRVSRKQTEGRGVERTDRASRARRTRLRPA